MATMTNKHDLGCLIIGVFTSTFFEDLVVKTILTTISMMLATFVSFHLRHYLHARRKEKLKNKNK